jgi:hypothetical protein
MLGLVMFQVPITFVSGSNVATPASMANLAVGQMVNSSFVPSGPPATVIQAIGVSTITLSNAATSTGTDNLATIANPIVPNQVRIAWQIEGQPGPPITTDTVTVRCVPYDADYGRMRDVVGTAGETSITNTDVFTRGWKVSWTFYGPDGLDNARAIRSALITIPFVYYYLSGYNLYVIPSIKEPSRGPQEFQGRWWERIDLEANFYEQITETFEVGLVESVPVSIYTKDGEFESFTVTEPEGV